MALELSISRASLNAIGRVAYLKDTTSYTTTGGWNQGANRARTDAAIIIFCTKIGKTSADDVNIPLLDTYDADQAPETSNANSPTFVEVDVFANGDGIYLYECVALELDDQTQALPAAGYYYNDTNNTIVYWDGSGPAEEVVDPYAVKSNILSSTDNTGYIADYSFYDIITTQSAIARDNLAVDLTDYECGCSGKDCTECIDKERIYKQLRLQIEGALANFSRNSYRSAAKNFSMISSLREQIEDLE